MDKQPQSSISNLFDSDKFQLERVEEFMLDRNDIMNLKALLASCFPEYPEQSTFFTQLPSFRYLAHFDNQLIGHLGVDFRMINNGGQICKALCISDVCVKAGFRKNQLASKMLQQLENDAREKQIDFNILIANDSKIYQHLGYHNCANKFRWLMIQKSHSLGVVQRNLGRNAFMIKSISGKKWSNNVTDLLGPIF